MMDHNAIRYLNRKVAVQAARAHREPVIAEKEDIAALIAHGSASGFSIPNIGYHKPKGWREVGRYFVDKSGWGTEGEPALTQPQFFQKMKAGRGYAMVEEGEFQCYVAEFVRVKDAKIAA
jgi:hypothetical protein